MIHLKSPFQAVHRVNDFLSLFFHQSKSRKNGPIKAVQSVLGGGDSNNNENNSNNYNMPSKSNKPSSGGHHQQQQKSKSGSSSKNRKFKDDMSMAHSQSKEKVKANPYATIKMWRPVSSVTNATDDEVYQTFSNFDALRHEPAARPGLTSPDHVTSTRAEGLPPTGDLRNQQQAGFNLNNSRTAGVSQHRSVQLQSPRSNHVSSLSGHVPPPSLSLSSSTSRQVNGFGELPADYPIDSPGSPSNGARQVSFQGDSRKGERMASGTASSSRHLSSVSASKSHPSVPPPPPLPSSPPPSLPNGFSGNRGGSSSANRPGTDLSSTAPAAMSPATSPQDNSFQVVSDGTTTSVKLVLSHTYSDIELAGRDVERLLAELKLTIDSLRTRSVSSTGTRSSSSAKTPGQLGLCLSEFHVQTKAFVQAAKEVVSAANDSREERLLSRLQAAVHALARLFLHGQASMLMLPSVSDAQRLGMQLIKATNAFKATLGAAHAAMGKTLTDPHMKYLMRQATNLAALLGALLGTIKEVQTV